MKTLIWLLLWASPFAHSATLSTVWVMNQEIQLMFSAEEGGYMINLPLKKWGGIENIQVLAIAPAPPIADFSTVHKLLTQFDVDESIRFNSYTNPDAIFGETIELFRRLRENELPRDQRLAVKLKSWLVNSLTCERELVSSTY